MLSVSFKRRPSGRKEPPVYNWFIVLSVLVAPSVLARVDTCRCESAHPHHSFFVCVCVSALISAVSIPDLPQLPVQHHCVTLRKFEAHFSLYWPLDLDGNSNWRSSRRLWPATIKDPNNSTVGANLSIQKLRQQYLESAHESVCT